MLPSNVTSNLDYLANLGILDFDAASYIAGTRPRYVGSPGRDIPPVVYTTLDGTNLKQPAYDNFNGKVSQTPLWKKFLFGALAIGGMFFWGPQLVKLCRNLKLPSFKNLFSRGKNSAKNLHQQAKNSSLWNNTKTAFMNNWTRVKNAAKRNKP